MLRPVACPPGCCEESSCTPPLFLFGAGGGSVDPVNSSATDAGIESAHSVFFGVRRLFHWLDSASAAFERAVVLLLGAMRTLFLLPSERKRLRPELQFQAELVCCYVCIKFCLFRAESQACVSLSSDEAYMWNTGSRRLWSVVSLFSLFSDVFSF